MRCFIYFSFKNISYTPYDLGLLLSKNDDYLELPLNSDLSTLFTLSKNLLTKNYQELYFFTESVVWTKVYALEASLEIINFLQKEGCESRINIIANKLTRKDKDKIKNLDQVSIFSFPKLDKNKSIYLDGRMDKFLIEKQKYFQGDFRGFLQWNIGCPYACYYCFRSVKEEKIRTRNTNVLIDEIEYLATKFSIKKFFFIDDVFVLSKELLTKLVEEFNLHKKNNLRLQNISFSAMTRIEALDEYIVFLLKQLGFNNIQLGIQSINPNLKHYMNRTIDYQKFSNIAKILSSYKISLDLDIIIGLPEDDFENFRKTLDFCLSLKPRRLNVKQLYYTPNTLFAKNKDQYQIEVDQKKDLFVSPYIIKSKGISDDYLKKSFDYLLKKKKEYPDIDWKYLSQYGNWYDFIN